MTHALRVYFLLAVLYKGKFEISFDHSIIYVHSHNEFASLFSGSAVSFMDEWVNLQYRLTTKLFNNKLTHNYFQARETQGLVQLARSAGLFWASECTFFRIRPPYWI